MCSRCGQEHPVSSFYKGSAPDGLNVWCIACYRDWHRERYPTEHDDNPRPCAECGETFTPRQRRAVAYCSRLCKDVARRRAQREALAASKPERSCVWCGEPIPNTMRADAKFCSQDCNDHAHTVTRKMRQRAGETGDRTSALIGLAYIAKRDGFECGLCRRKVDMALRHPHPDCASIDHMVPVSEGGTNDLANLQLSHLRCNLSKRATACNEQLRLVG